VKKLILFGMTLALALPLVAARPAAAAQANVIAQAIGDKDPFALTWADDTNGNTKIDQAISQKIHDTHRAAVCHHRRPPVDPGRRGRLQPGLQRLNRRFAAMVMGRGGRRRSVIAPAQSQRRTLVSPDRRGGKRRQLGQ
jgi:hypothetical protein